MSRRRNLALLLTLAVALVLFGAPAGADPVCVPNPPHDVVCSPTICLPFGSFCVDDPTELSAKVTIGLGGGREICVAVNKTQEEGCGPWQ